MQQIEPPPEIDVDAAPFAAAAAEGPFGFKPDRTRPIEPHFDGFGRLTPEQARQVLDVRDGRRRRCVVRLPTEAVLIEHFGQGYCDAATGQQWGYRVRRVGLSGPQVPGGPPPVVVTTAEPIFPAVVEPPPFTPSTLVEWSTAPATTADPEPADGPAAEADDHWTAPARSPRATALADPAERAVLLRVLVLWFVVVLLLVECVTLLVGGR